ncbi:hypothetical protein ACH3XW_36490 [Acanthocheilonema viteae]|uniref:Uncharacterized protein n=1 Tax=Acanthocheilonema viteae TaxID=6277 RepID=A0A498SUU7_ACAVI|nr:unnamed protein product [Acanthocheilonema viteae]
MVDVAYSLVLLLAAFVKFVQGLPIFQEANYEPYANYLKSFDYDRPNLSLGQLLPLPVLNLVAKKNIAIGRADGLRPGK